MFKHLDDEVAKRFYHGGRVFFYSDPHFSDIDSYKKRFANLFKIPFALISDLVEVYRKNNVNILEAFSNTAVSNLVATIKQSAEDEEKIVKLLDEAQIRNINSKCSKNDTLVILGDVGNVEYVKKLKAGYKVLVMGNHDAGSSNYKKHTDWLADIDGKHIVLDQHFIDTHPDAEIIALPNFEVMSYNLFDEVKEGTMQIGPKIMLSHEPLEHSDFWLNIHGHNHTNVQDSDTNHFNAIAECLEYFPISLDEIIESKKLKDIVDIHRKTIDKATERKHKKGAQHGK